MAQSGWRELFDGPYRSRTIAIAGATIIYAVNIFIATTALPSVVEDIGGLRYYSWSTTLFVVASIIAAPLSATILGRLQVRGAYRVALLVFGLGALACALAPTMPVLLLGRAIQGFGGGMISALAYATIRLVFPQALWSRMMALNSAMWGIATVAGPAVGGIFAEINWRLAFAVLVPIVAALAVLLERILPRRVAQADEAPVSVPRLQLGLLALTVLVISAASVSESTTINVLGLAGAGLLFGSLVVIERRTTHRLLPSGTFRPSSAIGPLYATLFLVAMAPTVDVFTPYFLQELHGLTPLFAGYVTAMMSVGWTGAAIPTSGLTDRRADLAITGGLVLMVTGLLTLTFAMPQADDSLARLAAISAGLVLLGMGIGSGWAHLLTRVLAVAPPEEQAITASSLTSVQLFAAAFGAAVGGLVTNLAGMTDPGGVPGAERAAFWLFATLAVAPVLGLVVFGAVRRRGAAREETGKAGDRRGARVEAR